MGKSAVSRAASLLGRRDDDDGGDFNNPGIFAMSVRLPSNIASLVSAMATQAGLSRNEMANLIVEAGIDSILSATAPESAAQIHESAEFHIADFIS
jgi:hypothetical protein